MLVRGCELLGYQTEVILGARFASGTQRWMWVVIAMCQEFERPPRGKDLKVPG